MRTLVNNGITFTYPDAVVFAYNPCIVMATGNNLSFLRAAVRYKTVEKADFAAYNKTAYADIRNFMQGKFDGADFAPNYDDTAKTTGTTINGAQIILQAYAEDGTLLASTNTYCTVVWGALAYGETFNGFRTAKMWRGFPFSFSFYTEGSGKLVVAPDGVMSKTVDMPFTPGIYSIPVAMSAKSYYDVYDFSGKLSQAAFSTTFDLTFSKVASGTYTHKARIYVGDNEYADGVYLRWIDRHGFWQQYLFRAGDTKAAISSDGEFMRNNLLAYDQSYGFQGINGRRQSYGREDTREICAPLVDSDTFDILMDLPTSPVVDMYVDGGWIAVTIKAGTYTKSGEDLQDFICNVVMPEYFLQSL